MASVAKVCGAEAEEHGHGTTVTALVLEQIGAVFGAHLSAGHVAAPAAHQLRGVVFGAAHVQFATSFTAVVRLTNDVVVDKKRISPGKPFGTSADGRWRELDTELYSFH